MWISGRTLEGHTDIRCMCRWTGVSRFEGCSTSLDKFSESPNHYDTPTTKHQHISKSSQDAITIKSHWQISWGWAKGENLKWTTSNNFRELEGEEKRERLRHLRCLVFCPEKKVLITQTDRKATDGPSRPRVSHPTPLAERLHQSLPSSQGWVGRKGTQA